MTEFQQPQPFGDTGGMFDTRERGKEVHCCHDGAGECDTHIYTQTYTVV